MIRYEIRTSKEKQTKLQAGTQIAKKSMKQLLTASQRKLVDYTVIQQSLFINKKFYKQILPKVSYVQRESIFLATRPLEK